MLKPANTPKVIPERLTNCTVCGCQTISKTKAKLVCDDCARNRVNAYLRRVRRERAIAAGVDVLGVPSTCPCGATFTKASPNHRLCDGCKHAPKLGLACLACGAVLPRRRMYCPPCAADRERVAGRAASAVAARARGVRAIGSQVACATCGEGFTLLASSTKHCPTCLATYHARWRRQRLKSDHAYNMNDRIRRAINLCLPRGGKRRRSWEALVGYTKADLIRHLERQFLPGMTWENRRRWHIDHVTPLRLFKFETPDDPEFRAAWVLSNLRPLWKNENETKQGQRTHLI